AGDVGPAGVRGADPQLVPPLPDRADAEAALPAGHREPAAALLEHAIAEHEVVGAVGVAGPDGVDLAADRAAREADRQADLADVEGERGGDVHRPQLAVDGVPALHAVGRAGVLLHEIA